MYVVSTFQLSEKCFREVIQSLGYKKKRKEKMQPTTTKQIIFQLPTFQSLGKY